VDPPQADAKNARHTPSLTLPSYTSAVKPHPCPICKKPVSEKGEAWPFCSERCRVIDLGQWLDGKYKIAGSDETDKKNDDS
jgi:uncharacterized protein